MLSSTKSLEYVNGLLIWLKPLTKLVVNVIINYHFVILFAVELFNSMHKCCC